VTKGRFNDGVAYTLQITRGQLAKTQTIVVCCAPVRPFPPCAAHEIWFELHSFDKF